MRARYPLAIVLFTIFLDLLGFGVILPIVTYYAQSFHATEGQVGLLGTVYSLSQLVFVPFWGRLSDRIGRRPVILVSVAGSAIGFAIFGAARTLMWLYLARAFAGAMTANISTVQAYVADVTTPADRAKGMGLMGAAFGLGFILGPFIGGELGRLGHTTGLGLGLVGYGAAALSALNFALALFFLPESLAKDAPRPVRRPVLEELRATLGLPGLVAVFAVSFAAVFAMANMEWTFALLTENRLGWDAARGPQLNGRIFGLVGVISVVVQGAMIGPLSRRFGERRLLIVGCAINAAGLACLGFVFGLPVLLVATTLISVGNSFVGPAISTLASRIAPAERQGEVLGAMQSVGALARVVGPASGGFLFQLAGVPMPFLIAGAAMTVAMILTLTGIRQPAAAEVSLPTPP